MVRLFAVAALSVLLFTGADWPQFRGPDGSGVSEETGLATTWSATENIVWKLDMPGFGASSPIVLGDKLFLTCYSGYGFDGEEPGEQAKLMLHTLCIDRASGKIVWDKTLEPKLPETGYGDGRIVLHGYASATPATDGEAVYVFFGKSGVLKYGLDGELLWNKSVGTEVDGHRWGSGASPIIHKGVLILNAGCESKSIRGLKTSDGSQVWQVDGIIDSWATPQLVSTDSGDEVVIADRSQILGIDPATGKKLWYCDKPSDYICPTAVVGDGVVYIINSRFKAAPFAVKPGGRGNVTDTHLLWEKSRFTTRVSTPIFHEGRLYAIDQSGEAYCLDGKTGDEIYRERLDIDGSGDKIYASLVAADGKIYGVTRLDGTVVLALTPKFKLLAHNRLDDSVANATPAIVDGKIYLRSDKALYCIGK